MAFDFMFPPIEANCLAAEKIAEALLTQEEEVLFIVHLLMQERLEL